MLLTLRLMEGEWLDYMAISLVFNGYGKGTWRIIDKNWVNLVAYEYEGTFVRQNHGGYPALLCSDGHSEGPAFILMNGPTGEWSKSKTGGDAGLIENPRNSYGRKLDMTWTDSNLLETTL